MNEVIDSAIPGKLVIEFFKTEIFPLYFTGMKLIRESGRKDGGEARKYF